MYEWVIGPVAKVVEQYKASLARRPNPPVALATTAGTLDHASAAKIVAMARSRGARGRGR